MEQYNHTQALVGLHRSIAGIIEEGRIPLRDYSRPIRARHTGPCGPYCFSPGKLITGRDNVPEGFGGYSDAKLTEMGSFVRLRISQISLAPYFVGGDVDADPYFPVVATLPRKRGFLAGWTLGGQMLTSFSRTVHKSEREAKLAAYQEAESAAARECEYREMNPDENDAPSSDDDSGDLANLRRAILRHPVHVSGDDDLTDAGLIRTAALILDRIAEDKSN